MNDPTPHAPHTGHTRHTSHENRAHGAPHPHPDYTVRPATAADVDGARSVMLDTFYRDFDYGYVPRWHADAIDIAGSFLDDPRHLLLVAVYRDGEDDAEIVGTTGVRSVGPQHPPHPAWLAERYPSGTTAQIVRVYVEPKHRRHGLARHMVHMACEFAAATPGYESIYLHTNVRVEGADGFWRSLAKEVCDARKTGEHGPGCDTVHFEIPMPN